MGCRGVRLHEIDAQCVAIRNGLSTIVPARLLTLFNWKELQMMVCGSPVVDIDLLKVRSCRSCLAISRVLDGHVIVWGT